MCGIVAFFSRSSNVSKEVLLSSTQALRHRGPDGQKVWVSRNKKAGLGHARLSIIDLNSGDQPLSNESGDIQAVVNGELYNFESIRGSLESNGHKFSSKSDSELVPHLYETHGTDCLKFLRGEFAFALWDDKNQMMFAARDRFGIKPLYYGWKGDTLIFGSEIKALLVAGVRPRWDFESNFLLHQMGAHSIGQSLFEGIFQVPPGHFVLVTQYRFQIIQYWDFDYLLAENSVLNSDPQELILQVREKLSESIKLRLRADVPVGMYLSGGLDSNSILGITTQLMSQKPTAFTIGFDQQEYDEAPIARETATRLGVPYNEYKITEKDLVDNFEESLWYSETLPENTHGVAKFLLSKSVNRGGYRVVLTGEGSDEIFAGYATFRRDMILYNSGITDQSLINQKLAELNETNKFTQNASLASISASSLPSANEVLGYVPSAFEQYWKVGQYFRSLYHRDFLKQCEQFDPIKLFLNTIDVGRRLSGRDPVHQSMYLQAKSKLPNYTLNILGDRMEMANSVEGRVPFLDHELVELVQKIPISMKIKDGVEKYILREAVRPFISDSIYKRQKARFRAPSYLLKDNGPFTEFVRDVLTESRLKDIPFFDSAKVCKLINDLPRINSSERKTLDPVVITILSTVLMNERFKVES